MTDIETRAYVEVLLLTVHLMLCKTITKTKTLSILMKSSYPTYHNNKIEE